MDKQFIESEILIRYMEASKDAPNGGGLPKSSSVIWNFLLDYQQKQNISGNIFELGVWYGYTACLGALHLKSDEKLFLLDLYLKEKEIRKTFDQIVGIVPQGTEFYQLDSIVAQKQDLFKPHYGTFRWFHIDGEHSYDAVYHDLELALKCIKRDGVIVVDDFFNPASACITEAVFNFLYNNKHAVRMFCCAYNKAYLTSPKWLRPYREELYYNIGNNLAEVGVSAMVAKNGWGTEIDYISIVKQRKNFKLQNIGKSSEELKPF